MDARIPVRDAYDAVVDLLPYEGVTDRAYAIAKFTFVWRNDDPALALDAPEPLLHDFRDASLVPRLRPGTDFWPCKHATDIVVRGSAFARDGRGVEQMTAAVRFGSVHKRVRVFGRREIHWNESGAPRIGLPERFEQMPITYENAYGGIDYRAVCDITDARGLAFLAGADHPGAYPRNPFGKGYLAARDRLEGAEMPNLEDPSDVLTPERLVVPDPAAWYRQPIPWCFDWVHPMTFPRYLFTGDGIDAWFPSPDDTSLAEVTRGFLPEGFRSVLARAAAAQVQSRFHQEASLGLVVRDVRAGTPVEIVGMRPEGERTAFTMPGFLPSFEFDVAGRRTRARARLHSVVIRPAVRKVHLVFGASVALHRGFVRGLHREIPVSVRIQNDPPLYFEAPEPIRDRVARCASR